MLDVFCFGTLALGMIALENPSFADSLSLLIPFEHALISPAKPISPNATKPSGNDLDLI